MYKVAKIGNATVYSCLEPPPVGNFNKGDLVNTSSGPYCFDGLKWKKVEHNQNIPRPGKWTIFIQKLRALKFHLKESWDYLRGKHVCNYHVCNYNDYD